LSDHTPNRRRPLDTVHNGPDREVVAAGGLIAYGPAAELAGVQAAIKPADERDRGLPTKIRGQFPPPPRQNFADE
jgi:hypothetical protein